MLVMYLLLVIIVALMAEVSSTKTATCCLLYDFSQSRLILVLRSANETHDSDLMDFSIKYRINPRDHSDFYGSMTAKLHRDIPNLKLRIQLWLSPPGKFSETGKRTKVFDSSVMDLCKLFHQAEQGTLPTLIRYVFHVVASFGPMPEKCPIRKVREQVYDSHPFTFQTFTQGFYRYENITLDVRNNPFTHLIPGSADGMVELATRAMIGGKEHKLYTMNFYGGCRQKK